MSKLATIQTKEIEMTPAQLLQAAIQGGVTSDNVAVVEKLIQMQLDMRARDALAISTQAFGALQSDCKPLAATKVIPGKNGEIRSTFTPIEEIKTAIAPFLAARGFGYSATQSMAGNLTTVTVTLTHLETGCERSSSFTCREQSSPGNTPAQNDSGTATLAERRALAMLLGLRFDHTADARELGDTISKDEAADLERRVLAISRGDDKQVERYLKLADAANFATVKRAKYEVVIQLVEMKERAK